MPLDFCFSHYLVPIHNERWVVLVHRHLCPHQTHTLPGSHSPAWYLIDVATESHYCTQENTAHTWAIMTTTTFPFFFFNNFFISLELAIVSIYHLLGFLCHYLYFNSNCNPKTKNSEQFHLARLIIHFAINPGTSLHLSPWKPLFSLSCVIAFFNLLHFVGAYPVVASWKRMHGWQNFQLCFLSVMWLWINGFISLSLFHICKMGINIFAGLIGLLGQWNEIMHRKLSCP